jgi:hypothetical protein
MGQKNMVSWQPDTLPVQGTTSWQRHVAALACTVPAECLQRLLRACRSQYTAMMLAAGFAAFTYGIAWDVAPGCKIPFVSVS